MRVTMILQAFFASSKPLVLGSGVTEATFEQLQWNCWKELEEGKIPQYTRFQCVYARKRKQCVHLISFGARP